MGFKARILINKRTKQRSIMLSKKKIEFLQKHNPKFINVNNFDFDED